MIGDHLKHVHGFQVGARALQLWLARELCPSHPGITRVLVLNCLNALFVFLWLIICPASIEWKKLLCLLINNRLVSSSLFAAWNWRSMSGRSFLNDSISSSQSIQRPLLLRFQRTSPLSPCKLSFPD